MADLGLIGSQACSQARLQTRRTLTSSDLALQEGWWKGFCSRACHMHLARLASLIYSSSLEPGTADLSRVCVQANLDIVGSK